MSQLKPNVFRLCIREVWQSALASTVIFAIGAAAVVFGSDDPVVLNMEFIIWFILIGILPIAISAGIGAYLVF